MYTEIKSFQDACKALGITESLPDVSLLPVKHQKAIVANYQLTIIAEAVNRDEEGKSWHPDWNDYDEYKYYPWFDMETYGDALPGSGFAFYDDGFDVAYSHVGSRLCFRSSEIAEYVGKQFLSIYRDAFLIERE